MVENSERLDWLGIERDDWGTFDRLSVDFLFEAKGFLESLGSLFDEYDSIPSEEPSMAETETLFEKKTGIFSRMRHVKSSIDAILGDNDTTSEVDPINRTGG